MVFEFNDLVKVFEDYYGVLVVVVVVVMLVGGVVGGDVGGVVEEKIEFEVYFILIGDKKIGVIKVVCEVISFGFKEVKDFVELVLCFIKEGVFKEEVEEMKGKFEEVGV